MPIGQKIEGNLVKILVVSDIPPFVIGGAEIQALRLIDAWLADGHEVQCIGRNLQPREIDRPSGKLKTHPISLINGKGKYLRAVSYFFSLSKFLLTNKKWPDVIYVRFLGDAAATICFLKYLNLIKAPLVSTPANAGAAGDLFYIASAPISRFWIRLINSHCNAINLIAPEMLNDLKAANITKPLVTQIPNGVPIYENTLSPNNSHIISLISVGRLSNQKGYDIFLEALSKLNCVFSSFLVTIIGDGPERKKLLNLTAHYGLQDKIHFLGELNQSEIRNHLQNADIFVLPSRYEGMSNAGLEAMEASRPLILTGCGGLDAHILSNMGWVATPGSVDSLFEKLLCATSTDKRILDEMGANNRDFAVNFFSMNSIAHRYIELFNSLDTQKNENIGNM